MKERTMLDSAVEKVQRMLADLEHHQRTEGKDAAYRAAGDGWKYMDDELIDLLNILGGGNQ